MERAIEESLRAKWDEEKKKKKKKQQERPDIYGKEWLIETEADLRQCLLYYCNQFDKIGSSRDEEAPLKYLLDLI